MQPSRVSFGTYYSLKCLFIILSEGLQTFVESQGRVSEFSKRTSIETEIFLEVLSDLYVSA